MSTKVFSLGLPVSASCVRSRQWVVEVKAAGGVLASLHKSACCANGGEDRLDPYLDLLRPRCLDIFPAPELRPGFVRQAEICIVAARVEAR